MFVILVPTSGTLPAERRGGNGRGLCYLEYVTQKKGDILGIYSGTA